MTRCLLLILFLATIGSRALGLDFGVAPGVSIKNIMLYMAASAIVIESTITRSRKLELLPVIIPFSLLVLYALLTWLVTIYFVDNRFYSAPSTLIQLKIKLGDQLLMLLVFFYGITNLKEAVWLLQSLIWVVIAGSLITVVDTFDIPDLGVVTTRAQDGRVEGIIGSAQEFGGLLAFFLPAIIALWWTESGLKKSLALVGIGLAFVSLMLSASRGAILGLLAGALFAAIYLREFIAAKVLIRASTAILLLAAIATLLVLSTEFGDLLTARLSTGVGTGDMETLSSSRSVIWAAALREMAEHPFSFITGLGWEAYYETAGHRSATHSVYLDRLYNLGIIGLTLFALSFVNAIAIARRGVRNVPDEVAPFLMVTVIGMTAYMIAMAFSDLHTAAIYVWAYTGIALRIAVIGLAGKTQPIVTHPMLRR